MRILNTVWLCQLCIKHLGLRNFVSQDDLRLMFVDRRFLVISTPPYLRFANLAGYNSLTS